MHISIRPEAAASRAPWETTMKPPKISCRQNSRTIVSRQQQLPWTWKTRLLEERRLRRPPPQATAVSPLHPDRTTHVGAHHRPATHKQTRQGAAERCGRTNSPPPTPVTRRAEHRHRHQSPRTRTTSPDHPLNAASRKDQTHQDASTIRSKGQDFRPKEGGGGGLGSLTHSQEGERTGAPPASRSTWNRPGVSPIPRLPRPHPRQPDLTGQRPDRREETAMRGRGREEEEATCRCNETSSPSHRQSGRKGRPSPPKAVTLASRATHTGARQQILAATFTGRCAIVGRLLWWWQGGGRKERWWMLGFGSLLCRPGRAMHEPWCILVHPFRKVVCRSEVETESSLWSSKGWFNLLMVWIKILTFNLLDSRCDLANFGMLLLIVRGPLPCKKNGHLHLCP